MSRGGNGKSNEVSYDFDKCETEDDIKRGLRLYFSLEDYDAYAARAFLGFRPSSASV